MENKGSKKPKSKKTRKGKGRKGKMKKSPNQFLRLGPRNMKGPFGNYDDINPFPPRLPVTMVYVDELILSSSNTSNVVGTTHKFGLNNLYDPNLQLGGHQPYGFDQLLSASGPYARYKVNGCKVTFTFMDPSIDTALNACMAVYDPVQYGAGETIAGKTIQRLKEQPNTVVKYVSNTGTQKSIITQYFDMARIANISKTAFIADTGSFTGSYGGAPGSICAVEVGVLDVRSSSPATSIVCTVKLEFYCILYDRYTLGQS